MTPTQPPESTEPRTAAQQNEMPAEVYEAVGDALTTFFDTDQWSTADFQHTVAYIVESARSAIIDSGYTIAPTEPGRVADEPHVIEALLHMEEATDDDMLAMGRCPNCGYPVRRLATITPAEPGRVVISVDDAITYRRVANEQVQECVRTNRPCAADVWRGKADRLTAAIAAAERTLTEI